MASFLVVDDNALVRRALSRVLRRYGECRTSSSAADADRQINAETRWDGFVFDVLLGDGCGLELLETARRSHARTPAVVLSGNLDRDAVNRAAILNARFVCKPCGTSELAPFVSDVLVQTTGDRVFASVERARHRWSLSPREVDILDATCRGRSRDEFITQTGITANTFKSQVRHLLEKTRYENLARLAIDLLTEN